MRLLDRWNFSNQKDHRLFYNYLGFGADAQVALRFHLFRKQYPFLFRFSCLNVLWYVWCILLELLFPSTSNLHHLNLQVDDVFLNGSEWKCILFLNISHFCGGGLPLGPHTSKSQCCDKKIEVIGFRNIPHILLAKVDVSFLFYSSLVFVKEFF